MQPRRSNPAHCARGGTPAGRGAPAGPVPERDSQRAGPGSERDSQRAAVYAAEGQVGRILDRSGEFPVVEVAGSHITLPVERHFGDIPSVQRYVDAILALSWVLRTWPKSAARPITVRARRGSLKAHYEPDGAVIAVPPARGTDVWAMRELVVLHEVAHHLGAPHDLTHGPAFTGRMLTLVNEVLGPEVALLLRISLTDQGAIAG